MRETTCNQCGNSFFLREADIYSISDADIIVQAFDCPTCGKTYQVITTDSEMRGLIEKSRSIQQAIRTAHIKKFSRKTIRQYERALDKIKKKQLKMLPNLRKVGEEILSKINRVDSEK